MDLDLARTIAAFGGLALGLLNFWLLVHKEYLRKPKIRALLKNASIRAIEDGMFDIQLDLDLNSKSGDSYLKEISFEHKTPIFNPAQGVNKRTVFKIIEYPGYNALDCGSDKLEEKFVELFKSSFNVANTKISDKEHKIFSMIDRICTERYMDGYWEWPKRGWQLKILSSSGEIVIPFNFTIHETNKTNAFIDS